MIEAAHRRKSLFWLVIPEVKSPPWQGGMAASDRDGGGS